VIGSLRGTVIDRSPAGQVVVEVAGVGYRVQVLPAALARLELGRESLLWIHHHMREDHQALYGFAAVEERVAFEGLLAAHGVGPALALAILATHPPVVLARVLAEDDLAALCEVPGVGRKTAQRLLVELKSRLILPVIELVDDGAGTASDGGGGDGVSPLADVRAALANLGYGGDEVRRATADLPVDGEAGDLLRLALRALAG
jgi:holliday junction DNA helicase RuvA